MKREIRNEIRPEIARRSRPTSSRTRKRSNEQCRQLFERTCSDGLAQDGILHRSASQQIVDVDGTSARWMLDSLGFSLTADGAGLAGKVMLEQLSQFEGRQLATFGTIGIPLMQGIIHASKGRYRGLLVRKEVKTYGARRRIEGRNRPARNRW